MSTIFQKDFKNTCGWVAAGGLGPSAPQGLRCSLCRGEVYPGDPYFELEVGAVCEDCLGRYARSYFAHRLRRVGRSEKETL